MLTLQFSILLTLITSISTLSDCLVAGLAWEIMSGDTLYTPSADPASCCGKNGIECSWTLQSFITPRRRITAIVWDKRKLAGTIAPLLFQLDALTKL